MRRFARQYIVDRLETNLEFIFVERLPQTVHPANVSLLAVILTFGSREDSHPVTARRLGVPASDVSLIDQLIVMQVVTRHHRNADAAMNMEYLLALDVGHATHIGQNGFR